MKTAIVLGATGLIGHHLVSLLAKQNHIEKVIAVTRRPMHFEHANVINRVIDFEDIDSYCQVFKGDMLFSCLGTTLKQAGSRKAQYQVDVTYQLQAAQCAIKNQVREYFLVSSSGANAHSTNAYLQMKGELENLVCQLAFTRICIFQPSLLLGTRSHFRLAESIGSWILPTLCKLPFLTRYSPIKGEQVAKKMCQQSVKTGSGISRFTLDECRAE